MIYLDIYSMKLGNQNLGLYKDMENETEYSYLYFEIIQHFSFETSSKNKQMYKEIHMLQLNLLLPNVIITVWIYSLIV